MVDPTTQAALEAPLLYWRALLYADFDGDPLRITSGIYDKTVSASGDAELDGTYASYSQHLIEVGAVKHNETGSDTATITLNGILVNSAHIADRAEMVIYDRHGSAIEGRASELLSIIGDKGRWQGRAARIWFYCGDADDAQVGEIVPYYTGYMNDVVIAGSPETQKITLTIENYLASLAGSPNQTYMMQATFDPGDLSAAATLGAANGLGSGTASAGGSSGIEMKGDRYRTQSH